MSEEKKPGLIQAVGDLMRALDKLDQASGSSFCGKTAQKIRDAAGDLVKRVVSGKPPESEEPQTSEWT